MATLKHLSSKNADYGAAEQYLTFEHDEFTGRPILDEHGRLVPRQDYRISSLNCGGEDFAVACMRANLRYGKNQRREDVKRHHCIRKPYRLLTVWIIGTGLELGLFSAGRCAILGSVINRQISNSRPWNEVCAMERKNFICRFREIEKILGYTSEWKPSVLFERLKNTNYSTEEKVGFILYCYGWNGHNRTISNIFAQSKEYQTRIFNSGKHFIEQFDNLIFPCKSSSSKSGSHVWITFSWNPVITAGVSTHFGERVVFMGIERNFDGYEDNNIADCWEDITISPDNLDFDEVNLYLGESGKVYWFCYDGDSLGVAADNLLEFFSIRFSFIEDKYRYDFRTTWTVEDLKAMRNYQKASKG